MNISLNTGFYLSSNVEYNVHKKENWVFNILEYEESIPLLRTLSFPTRYAVSTFILIPALIGSCFNFLLYRYILISSKRNNGSYFKMTPVNVLLFNATIVHHFILIYSAFFLIMSIGTDLILEDALGQNYCHATRYLGIQISDYR